MGLEYPQPLRHGKFNNGVRYSRTNSGNGVLYPALIESDPESNFSSFYLQTSVTTLCQSAFQLTLYFLF